MSANEANQTESIRKAICLLILAGLCVYCNSFTKQFIFDDDLWIVASDELNRPRDYLRTPNGKGRPIIALTIIINHELGGRIPLGYHLFNLAVHILAGLTLFGIVRRTLLLHGSMSRGDRSTWLAFAIALLWLVHPIQTQSVTYIIQRCESLMGLFFLTALYCAIRSWDSPCGRCWIAGAVLCSALGAGSKEVIAGAPILIVLYDWIFRERSIRALLKRRWLTYLALAGAAWSVLAYARLSEPAGAAASAGFRFQGISPKTYFLTQPGVILHYLRQVALPTNLCFDYEGWRLASAPADWLVSGVVLLVLFGLTVFFVIRRSWLGFVGAWFFVVLGPSSSFIPIADVAYEYRMYLPLASVITLIVIGFDALIGSTLARGNGSQAALSRALSVIALIGCAAALSYLTLQRNEDYRTPQHMWADVVKKNPNGGRGHFGLARLLFTTDREQARQLTDRALQLDPRNWDAYHLRGRLQALEGDYQGALPDLNRAYLHVKSRHLVLELAGYCYYELGDLDRAIRVYRQASSESATDASNRLSLGLLLQAKGNVAEAEMWRAAALPLAPNLASERAAFARRSALAASVSQTQLRQALFAARQAVFADPTNPNFIDTLAITQAALGEFEEAAASARQALALAQAQAQSDFALAAEITLRIQLFELRLPYQLDKWRNLQAGTLLMKDKP